ncbi:efflux RND transporter periplasmic adaptor subunit [Bradyrhizobium acaciae]|uniref:efflux RND transporter periplasmic adaptor subunit n=1 Tax=Bradyrhizobium acaciae TaxID=2683706 RepID=UPI001E64601B|nr:efflux RND transporter periplasmic adaptor subunit [Bradyrhizobium acaciae]MCC8979031.1 efflux RND transporter periplasmic adaptor subunit [Bradyrhizobium acaciae]
MMKHGIRISAMLCICFAAAGCEDQAVAPLPVRPVLSTVLKPGLTESSVVVGTVEPQFKTDLSFRVQGRLIARPVYIGDTIEKAQTVAAIDPTSLELAVRSAIADVSSSQAKLTNASGFEERQRTLLKTEVISQADMESAEQSTASAQATLVRAQADLTKAREQLGYAQLKAEFAGVVTAVGAEVGQVVSSGQTVVTVARPEIREAVIDVADDVASTLRIGQPFTVSLQLDPAIQAEGRIREIAPQADAVTRTRRVRITLDNPPTTFRLGTTVMTPVTSSHPTLRLPVSAILVKDGKTLVWLVDPSKYTVALREVTSSADDGSGARIVAGIEEGSRVVTAGVHSLVDGQKVRIDQEAKP